MAREVNYYQLSALGADEAAPVGYLARIKAAKTTEELSSIYNGALVDPAVSREMLKELGEAYAWKYAELITRPGKKGPRWHYILYAAGVALLWKAWRDSQGKPFNPFAR